MVEYVQLAHNVRHPRKGYPKAEVIHSFGRRDQLDIEGLKRLVSSIGRFIGLDDHGAVSAVRPDSPSTTFIRSQRAGGVFLLRGLWTKLKIGACLKEGNQRRPFSEDVERALFALVAAAALDLTPGGRTIFEVLSDEVFPGEDRCIDSQLVNHAVECLRGHPGVVCEAVGKTLAGRLNLTRALIYILLIPVSEFSDAMAPPSGRDDRGNGHLPSAVAMAVSPGGVPLKSWSLPDSRINTDFIQRAQADLAAWDCERSIWVMDKQVAGNGNLDVLRGTACDYILAESLRQSRMTKATERRKGRFKILGPDLQIKMTIMGKGADQRRWVIASHPEQARRDREEREQTLRRLQNELEKSKAKGRTGNAAISWPGPDIERYVKILKSGIPKIDISLVRQEEKNDGKYLLFCNDESVTPETIARGHKLLRDTALACHALGQSLPMQAFGFRPHDDAGVLLSWMALLLMRIAEFQVGMPWWTLCREMQRLHLGEFYTGNRRIFQYTELTGKQKTILKRLNLNPPQFDPTKAAASG